MALYVTGLHITDALLIQNSDGLPDGGNIWSILRVLCPAFHHQLLHYGMTVGIPVDYWTEWTLGLEFHSPHNL